MHLRFNAITKRSKQIFGHASLTTSVASNGRTSRKQKKARRLRKIWRKIEVPSVWSPKIRQTFLIYNNSRRHKMAACFQKSPNMSQLQLPKLHPTNRHCPRLTRAWQALIYRALILSRRARQKSRYQVSRQLKWSSVPNHISSRSKKDLDSRVF